MAAALLLVARYDKIRKPIAVIPKITQGTTTVPSLAADASAVGDVNDAVVIVPDAEKLQFMVTEAMERKEHKPTSEELVRQKSNTRWQPDRWDYTPTGRLKFTLESCEYPGISQSWADRRLRKLDTCVGEILVACQTMAAAIQRREDRACYQRELERRHARELEERERQEEYLRESKVIKIAAESLEFSQDIRRLVVCFGSTNKIHELSHKHFGQLSKMLEWCTEYANSLDPTNRLGNIVEEFTSRPRGGPGSPANKWPPSDAG